MLNLKELEIATGGKIINGNEKIIPKYYELDSRSLKEDDFFIPLKGEKVELSINKGRKKIETFFAVIQTLYPRIFTVSLNDGNENATKTYSYSEVMCGDLVIKKKKKTDA